MRVRWHIFAKPPKVVTGKEKMGLHRDDDLGTFKNMFRPEVERKKKNL